MFEPLRLRTPTVASASDTPAERPANRKIENLALTIFWLLLLEGALRKWVLPGYSRYIFFIRDPFLLMLYWQAYKSRAFSQGGPLLQAGVALSALAVLVAFAQSVTFGDARLLPVLAYGWRQYFLYLPLPFVMAASFNQGSLLRFARHGFLAVMMTAPLVLLQTAASPSAVINRGISDEVSLQFQSFAFTGGRIRPSGSFTTNVGVKELVASTVALLLAVWLTPPLRRRMGMLWLVLAATALATCLALSASRAAFLHVFVVMLSAMGLGLMTRTTAVRTRALIIPLALCATGVILYPLVFPDALNSMLARVSEAHATESRFSSLGVFGRALYEYVDFIFMIGHTPLLGNGLGLGGNGRTFLANSAAVSLADIYAESDWSRHIVDLGVVGVLFIGYRIAFVGTLLVQSVRATRVSMNPFPLLMFGYAGLGLLNGQITGQGTVGGFLWIFTGLCMASCRISLERR